MSTDRYTPTLDRQRTAAWMAGQFRRKPNGHSGNIECSTCHRDGFMGGVWMDACIDGHAPCPICEQPYPTRTLKLHMASHRRKTLRVRTPMSENAPTPDEPGQVYEYLILDSLRPALDAWLASRGLEARRAPWLDADDPDAIPVVLVTPSDELWNRALKAEQAKG